MNITMGNSSYVYDGSIQSYKVQNTLRNEKKWEKHLEDMGLGHEEMLPDDRSENVSEGKETETKDNFFQKTGVSRGLAVDMNMRGMKTKLSEADTTASQENEDYREILKERINEIFVKIQNGDTEPSFQIGNQSFTIREWDEFLEKFDSVEEAIKELVEEEVEKSKEAAYKHVKTDMLTQETVPARFPLDAVDEKGNQIEDLYLIAIDENGIRCCKAGSDQYEWEIVFTDKSQYEKATAFMGWASEHMDNFLFSAHENFWEDFLNGNMDEEGFKEFLEGTKNGIPNYGISKGDSMYIDKSKVQWAKYMNHPGAKFYTAQEMAEMLAETLENNKNSMTKLSGSYSEIYKKYHPEYNGEAIFCEYPGGPLYTADEIGNLMYERALQTRNPEWSIRKALGLI